MRGVRARAAIGSAHGLFQMAFTTSPTRAIQAMYPQRADSAASDFKAALEVTTANFRFRLASQGIITAAASRIPIPTRLRWASRYPKKVKIEVTTTKPASAKSKPPAIRAACVSPSAKRKRQNTTAAESSSIKLSPPKASNAGLCEVQAVPRDT